MIKELITDTELLSTPCEKGTAEDVQIVEDLVETLESIDDAACLAANQIGYTKRIVAIKDDNEKAVVYFNPVLRKALFPNKLYEACLSLEETVRVTRFAKISVAYEELVDGALVAKKAEMTDWPAQLMQHMIDHCNGKLV